MKLALMLSGLLLAGPAALIARAADETTPPSPQEPTAADRAVDKVTGKTEKAGHKMKKGAKKAGRKTKEGAKTMERKTGEGIEKGGEKLQQGGERMQDNAR